LIRFLKPAPGSSVIERFKVAIDDPELFSLLESWLRLAKDGLLPDKGRFDPLDHRNLLPRMWIYELTEDRSDFVGKLCGEEIRHVWRQTTKGLPLSQISSPDRFWSGLRRWLYCVTAPAVLLGQSMEQARFAVKRLSLPFTDPQGRLYVLGASQYDFQIVDPFEPLHPFRYSQNALAARAADLVCASHGSPGGQETSEGRESADGTASDDQAAINSRTWAAQASPRA